MRFILAFFLLLISCTDSPYATLEDAQEAYDYGYYELSKQINTDLANEGDSIAQIRLAMQYYEGKGVKIDFHKAFDWVMKSAEQGNDIAQYMAYWFYDHSYPYWFYGEGYNKTDDDTKAFYWLSKSADQGYQKARYKLAWEYQVGDYDRQDDDRGMDMLDALSDEGFQPAMDDRWPERRVKRLPSAPYEDLGDPDFYKTPRLQFVLQLKDDKSISIWSIKLDGSDLRKVIDPKKMFYKGRGDFYYVPVRSPNRRYIAYTYSTEMLEEPNRRNLYQLRDNNQERKLIDLKTGIVIDLDSGTGRPNFVWSRDSKVLFFYKNDEIFRFILKEKKVELLPFQFDSFEIFTLDDGKTLAAVKSYGVAFYNYDGELIKNFDLNGRMKPSDQFTVTPDGKYFFSSGVINYFSRTKTNFIYELSDPPKITNELNYYEKILDYYTGDKPRTIEFKIVRNIFLNSMVLDATGKYLINEYEPNVDVFGRNNLGYDKFGFKGAGEDSVIVKYSIETGEISPLFRGQGIDYPYHYSILY